MSLNYNRLGGKRLHML